MEIASQIPIRRHHVAFFPGAGPSRPDDDDVHGGAVYTHSRHVCVQRHRQARGIVE